MEHAKSKKGQEMSEEKQQCKDNRPVATCFDWEINQALIHLDNAVKLTSSKKAHFLVSAKNIIKGARDSE
jgi:hypothetical protein